MASSALPVSSAAPSGTKTSHAPPCVLLTGFDAFGGEALNPSWLAVQALNGETIAGHRVVWRTR